MKLLTSLVYYIFLRLFRWLGCEVLHGKYWLFDLLAVCFAADWLASTDITMSFWLFRFRRFPLLLFIYYSVDYCSSPTARCVCVCIYTNCRKYGHWMPLYISICTIVLYIQRTNTSEYTLDMRKKCCRSRESVHFNGLDKIWIWTAGYLWSVS